MHDRAWISYYWVDPYLHWSYGVWVYAVSSETNEHFKHNHRTLFLVQKPNYLLGSLPQPSKIWQIYLVVVWKLHGCNWTLTSWELKNTLKLTIPWEITNKIAFDWPTLFSRRSISKRKQTGLPLNCACSDWLSRLSSQRSRAGNEPVRDFSLFLSCFKTFLSVCLNLINIPRSCFLNRSPVPAMDLKCNRSGLWRHMLETCRRLRKLCRKHSLTMSCDMINSS